MAMILTTCYIVIRLGVADLDIWSPFKALAAAGFLIFFPKILARVGGFNDFAISFWTLIGFVILGLAAPQSESLSRLIVFSFAAITCYEIRNALKMAPSDFRKISRILVYGALFVPFVLALANFIWAQGFLSPLFLEKVKLGALNEGARYANPDTLFHTSIMQMIKNYSIPSTGLDGTPLIQYHIGFHFIMTAFGRLLNTRPIVFYQSGFPIIFSSFFLKTILDVSLSFIRYFNKTTIFSFVGALAIIVLIDIFPNFFSSLFYLTDIFTGENFTLALTLLFLFLGFAATTIGEKKDVHWNSLITALLMVGATAVTKISVGFICISSLMYLLFRFGYLKLWKWRTFALCVGSLGLVIAFVFSPRFNSNYALFALHRCVGAPKSTVGFYITHFIAIYIYAAFRLRHYWPGNFKQAWIDIKGKQFIDLEVVGASLVFSLLPVEIVDTQANWSFFTEVPTWVTLPFLIALSSSWIDDFRENIWTRGILCLCFLSITYSGFLFFKSTLMDRNHIIETRSHSLPNMRLPNTRLVDKLLALDENIPIEIKRITLLYIPKTNRSFWDALPLCGGFFWPPTVQFLGPALSGLAMIDGLPENICTPYHYGFSSYKTNTGWGRKEAADSELCQRAKALGFKNVLRLSGGDFIEHNIPCNVL